MIFEKGDRIVFAGDSVTDMGSQQPVGEGLFDNLGNGYVRQIECMLAAFYPDIEIRVTNSGVSGNTSRDLLARYERDVLNLNPQWVSICIGINDVWRQFDSPAFYDYQVPLEEYERNLEKMIVDTKDKVKGMFICSPYYMEPNREDAMRKRMDEYTAAAQKLAEKHNCIFVDFQAMYDRYFAHRHSCFIAWDRIHPNRIGATIMTKEILSKCGFDYNRAVY